MRLLALATDLALKLLRVRTETQAVTVSDEEVKARLHEGMRAGVFHRAEPHMVESVLAFDQRPVTTIMTPRAKVTSLPYRP